MEKGCGTALLVGILTLLGWFPGTIAALVILSMDAEKNKGGVRRESTNPFGEERRFVEVPVYDTETPAEKAKRKGAYVRLADGEVAEVVEDDGAPLEKRKRGSLDSEAE